MGAGHSAESAPPSLEQLSHALTQRFASKCYTPIEIYCFTAVFNSLADSQSGVKYWSETTLCRFLELPDALGVGPVVFQMASYLGAFPFPSHAPAILTQEALLKVVTIFTERYGAVLKKKGRQMWLRELYRSLAVYDRVNSPVAQQTGSNLFSPTAGSESKADATIESRLNSNQGFAIDAAVDSADGDGSDDDDDDDELVLAALDSMDVVEVFKQGEQSNLHHSIIPSDNFLRLIELLLVVAAIDPQQSISSYVTQLSEDRVERLRAIANKVLLSFAVDKYHGVSFKTFTTVVNATLPYLFDGLGPLFEHFLFAKDLELSKRKNPPDQDKSTEPPPVPSVPSTDHVPHPEPVLRTSGEIMNLDVLSQLSFFMKGSELFRRLRPLYLGNNAGFSMGSFEKSVFKWQAPSILLVSGTLLSSDPSSARERTLHDSLPHNRLPNSLSVSPHLSKDTTFTFGAYIPVPWKHSPKQCFGDSQTTLFQLSPMHDVFKASRVSTDYAYFNKPPGSPSGVGFGSAVSQTQYRTSSSTQQLSLGPVSLHLDDALEFGVFTHLSSGGGSFLPSRLPCRKGKDWQDRFEIESLEVWGCGGDEQAEAQRKAWAWEEREAEARRRINLGTGDIDADRELLKMAGLIGGDRSGGSV